MKKCPNCRREIDENSVFCEYCGGKVKRPKKFIIWVVLGSVATLSLAIIALVLIFRGVPDSDSYESVVSQDGHYVTVEPSTNVDVPQSETTSFDSDSNSDLLSDRESVSWDNDNGNSQQAAVKSQYEQLLDSDLRYNVLSESALYSLTPRELTYLRNSVYARHGYVFKSDELSRYFGQFSWYSPDYSVNGSELNATEIANVTLIKEYQKNNGKEYKPL